MSDPENRFIRKAIEKRDCQNFTCFDYRYLGFAISREVSIVPKEECHGLSLGEVQVKDKIDSEYITGLLLPISMIDMADENKSKIVDMLFQLCEDNGLPLDIYNYDGELLKSKDKIKKL